jgi:hypothetical protein
MTVPESVAWQFSKYFPSEMPKVALLGIRGYLDSENKMDIYDDLIIRWVDGQIAPFRCSVDPGSYYLNHPLNPQGCARLQCGLWSYTRGEHHTKRALVQADEVTIDRIDSDGRKKGEESGYFGINIHSGGPEYLVGRWSAGCQVLWTREPWKDEWTNFYDPLCAAMDIFNVNKIPYLLVDKLVAEPIKEI